MKEFFGSMSGLFKDLLLNTFSSKNMFSYLYIFFIFPIVSYVDIMFVKTCDVSFWMFLLSSWFLYVFSLININLITDKQNENISPFKINFVASSFVLLYLFSYMTGIFVFSYYFKFDLPLSLLLLISSLFLGTANANYAFYRYKKSIQARFLVYNFISIGLYLLEHYTLGENVLAYICICLLSVIVYIGSVKYANKNIKE